MSRAALNTDSLRQPSTFTHSRKNIAFRNSARLALFNRLYQENFLRRVLALFQA